METFPFTYFFVLRRAGAISRAIVWRGHWYQLFSTENGPRDYGVTVWCICHGEIGAGL